MTEFKNDIPSWNVDWWITSFPSEQKDISLHIMSNCTLYSSLLELWNWNCLITMIILINKSKRIEFDWNISKAKWRNILLQFIAKIYIVRVVIYCSPCDLKSSYNYTKSIKKQNSMRIKAKENAICFLHSCAKTYTVRLVISLLVKATHFVIWNCFITISLIPKRNRIQSIGMKAELKCCFVALGAKSSVVCFVISLVMKVTHFVFVENVMPVL
jgi:hypothetical protein